MAERNVGLHEFDYNPVAFARDFVLTLSAQPVITVPLSSRTRPLPLPQTPKGVKCRRCSWGKCNNDTRYLHRLPPGCKFIPFPKPKINLDKCMRWIKQCGRPQSVQCVFDQALDFHMQSGQSDAQYQQALVLPDISPCIVANNGTARFVVQAWCVFTLAKYVNMHGKFLYEQ